MWAFYIPSMLCVFLAVLALLRRYASPQVPFLARCLAVVGWLTSISIVALVPVDVWSTLNESSNQSITIMWKSCYWTSQALTWFLIPFMQNYCDAGEFTILSRAKASIKESLSYYSIVVSALMVGVAILLLTGRLTASGLLPLAVTLSNTYGLVAVILLLGYGLVTIPRKLWRSAHPEARLRRAFHKVGRCAERLEDATAEMTLVATVVEATSQPMARRDPLRPMMDLIYAQAAATAPLALAAVPREETGRLCLDGLTDTDLDYGYDAAGLAALRRRLQRAVHAFNGLQGEYVNAVGEALDLERVVKARGSGEWRGGASSGGLLNAAALAWHCSAEPWALRGAALSLAGASFLIIWSEATIGSGVHPDLSPFSHMIHSGTHGEVATQVLVGAPLAYMAACCYYSLFRLGVFSFYHVVPHATSPRSLLMNAAQVTRFAAPLAFNFLHVIRMHDEVESRDGEPAQKTIFAQQMGAALKEVSVFGTGFNSWFPLVVVVYCTLLWLNLWDALVRCCLPRRFRFDEDGGADDCSERGRALLRQEQEARLQGLAISDCLELWAPPGRPGSVPHARTGRLPPEGTFEAAASRLACAADAARARATDEGGVDPRPRSGGPPGASLAAHNALLRGRETPGDNDAPGASPWAPHAPKQLTRSLLRNNKHSEGDLLSSAASAASTTGARGGGLDDMFARLERRSSSGAMEALGRVDDVEAGVSGGLGAPSAAHRLPPLPFASSGPARDPPGTPAPPGWRRWRS